MTDLSKFLLARIAEDEAAARAELWTTEDEETTPGGSPWTGEFGEFVNRNMRFVCAWSPTRVLAECEAKRRIVTEARDYSPELSAGDNGEWAFDAVLRLLALPYANHADYRDEWRA